MKVVGDAEKGFSVDIYNGSQLMVHNSEEFSLKVSNLDQSEKVEIHSWKGSKWTGDQNKIILTGDTYLSNFDLNLSVNATYQVINQNVIKKSIELFQSGMPTLYYTLDESYKPAETPLKYVTFEHDDFPGGFVHEIFPSAGFVTSNDQLVGFLMDAGYKNHYTRTTRRRFNGHGGGFVGMRRLPDPALVSVATAKERVQNQQYIKQTFGEMYNLDAGDVRELKIDGPFQRIGDIALQQEPGLISFNNKSSGRSGIECIVPLKDQKFYTISFLSKGNAPVSLKLFRIKNGKKTIELEHGIKYIDHFPIKKNEWTLFKGSILVPYIENDSVSMFIGSQSGNKNWLQIKDLKIEEHLPKKEPYNKIKMGEKETKTTYIFVEPWINHHDFVISSQSRLAEGKGFRGTLIEKMLYANFNMLTWITSVNDFT
ncbi:MAG TPA: hypothetical protein VJ945_08980, partial [Flavobacteriaceae bacterium]|nr:hypothetical protein [Flavobacteriaceae bacterium]